MTTTRVSAGRRWFLRSTTGAALSVVAMGAQALFGASTASAHRHGSCCYLLFVSNAWCPLLCKEVNHVIFCWACNDTRCRCCECVQNYGEDCWHDITLCSYQDGCCEA